MHKYKVLVIGSSGQLASCLKERVDSNFLFIGRPNFDICNNEQILEIFNNFQPNIIINCCAYTNVDLAEKEIDLAYNVNSYAVEKLAIICAKNHIPLFHISTDYVFDGEKISPYNEKDKPNPLSIYGKSKLDGEKNIQKYLDNYIILRTSWIFSDYGTNFVKTMLRLSQEKDQINVIDDQHGCPTSAHNIAKVIIKIVERILKSSSRVIYGLYHYTDKDATSWYKFANNIFNLVKKKYKHRVPKIVPISTAQYQTLAVRPGNSVLDCSLIEANFGVKQQSWLIELEKCLERLNYTY